MSSPIVAHRIDETKLLSLTEPQAFTINCLECGDELGTHLSDCPGVIAAGYDTAGNGAFSGSVFPKPGHTLTKHTSAFSALRFYRMFAPLPIALHLADGRRITFDQID